MLTPMFGSELSFVARDEASRSAPGQLTLEQSEALRRRPARPPQAIFALVGNPAAHSISPSIHNPKFQEKAIDAVYVLIETADFEEVAEAFASGEKYVPLGLGVTAPFKEEAFRFVLSRGGEITIRARNAGSVNTIIRSRDGRLLADNTDIESFQAAIQRFQIESRETAAVIGAGGTARAALYALQEAGVRCTIFNRTYERALSLGSAFGVSAARLDTITHFEGRLIVNTAGGAVQLPEGVLRAGRMLINVGYSPEQAAMNDSARRMGMQVFDGVEFLDAQAPTQSRLFLEAAESKSASRRLDRGRE
jgi:shikimate dehydrogenase